MPSHIEKQSMEHYRAWVEQQLMLLTDLAEDWAEKRCNLSGSEILYRSAPRVLPRASLGAPLHDLTFHLSQT
jgi:hypothetical protein